MRQWRFTKGCNALARLIPRTGGRDMVEVGVFDGATSMGLLYRFPKLTLTMVDPWRLYPDKNLLSEDDWPAVKALALGRTEFAVDRRIVYEATSLIAAGWKPDASQDIVFIDGDHSYEAVFADIRAWWPKVRLGGILCGHDYPHRRFPGVRRAVDGWVRRWRVPFRPRWDMTDEDWDALIRARVWWVQKGTAR